MRKERMAMEEIKIFDFGVAFCSLYSNFEIMNLVRNAEIRMRQVNSASSIYMFSGMNS